MHPTSRLATAFLAAILLAGCGDRREAAPGETGNGAAPARAQPAATAASLPAAPQPAADAAARRWSLEAGGKETSLALAGPGARAALRLVCATGAGTLLVNVPAFRPIGSEERLSFGGGNAVVALVADTSGDRLRGGISGTGAAPAELPDILAAPLSASYGTQASGPHPAPPAELARTFAAACRAGPKAAAATKPAGESPCRRQGDRALAGQPLRATGTEPFWSARIDGRCVTYAHPENQAGTRIWTRYTPGAGGGGTWSGAHRGKPFVLEVRPAPGCSDGMSDRRYLFAAQVRVDGETRRGCAVQDTAGP